MESAGARAWVSFWIFGGRAPLCLEMGPEIAVSRDESRTAPLYRDAWHTVFQQIGYYETPVMCILEVYIAPRSPDHDGRLAPRSLCRSRLRCCQNTLSRIGQSSTWQTHHGTPRPQILEPHQRKPEAVLLVQLSPGTRGVYPGDPHQKQHAPPSLVQLD
ncbi:hypothetical protein BDW42DRAFT_110135 [Aspergillus taichungensis]|uniref:Uncharacterized protein n=1 Tax=Aspergillus taichungensis TaxID=482145 RepID=A0A2J5HTD1_9EURO|nr:hypothetical protein BDW42DRAFT_110135 [Aspergillus taichungensis]